MGLTSDILFTASECGDNSRGANGYAATIQCFSGVENAGTWAGPISVPGGPAAVPEPSAVALLAGSIGLRGLGWTRVVGRR
jgi:hypothetical protein